MKQNFHKGATAAALEEVARAFATAGRAQARRLLAAMAVTGLAAGAQAASVAVDCNAGDSISAALAPLDLQGPHTITVTGVCHESVSIMNRERLTIQAPAGQMATIARPAGAGPAAAVFVNGSSAVSLQRLVLTGAANGLLLQRLSDVNAQQVTTENNGANGMAVIGNSNLIVTASTVRNNAFNGIVGQDSSVLRVSGGTVIEGNGRAGLLLVNNSTSSFLDSFVRSNGQHGVALLASSTINLINNIIENNAWTGVNVAATSDAEIGGNTISGNGAGPGAEDTGGLVVAENSDALVGASTIVNNTGPGILATAHATLSMADGNTVSGNSEQGVKLERLAVAQFLGAGTIASNAEADLACDTTSLAAGDLSGVQEIRCARIEREHGRPRPGHVFAPRATHD
jgi:parallel beta-helix repeat protein